MFGFGQLAPSHVKHKAQTFHSSAAWLLTKMFF